MSKKQPRMDDDRQEQEEVVDARASAGLSSEASARSAEPGASPAEAGAAAAEEAEQFRALQEERDQLFGRYQRLAADFENFKRRTRQELVERTQYANEELLRKLLPLQDNFRRLLAHAPADVDPQWFEGVRLVARQFEDLLTAQGLAPISAVGEKFNPAEHEAIVREETDEHEEGTVLEELQPGYRLHQKVLRPTLVKVAQPRALNR